ncbi:hypothetical protein X801_03643 [Opisthorchis viverrini]|uniref:Uncharacterized protein n=1 Tax=Opisthorchis viverrini TaxID=6198 RepID=A0A1S8X180_OPIVI|nr:hypothetical protein X801_03643 [Opisthorchis viverrini]
MGSIYLIVFSLALPRLNGACQRCSPCIRDECDQSELRFFKDSEVGNCKITQTIRSSLELVCCFRSNLTYLEEKGLNLEFHGLLKSIKQRGISRQDHVSVPRTHELKGMVWHSFFLSEALGYPTVTRNPLLIRFSKLHTRHFRYSVTERLMQPDADSAVVTVPTPYV